MALQITDANFEELVNSGKPMVLDFWAEWCGPCRMVGPIIDELATEYEGRVTIGKMASSYFSISTGFTLR